MDFRSPRCNLAIMLEISKVTGADGDNVKNYKGDVASGIDIDEFFYFLNKIMKNVLFSVFVLRSGGIFAPNYVEKSTVMDYVKN